MTTSFKCTPNVNVRFLKNFEYRLTNDDFRRDAGNRKSVSARLMTSAQ